MKHSTTAIFSDVYTASAAVDELVNMGVDTNEISILMGENVHSAHFQSGKVKQVDLKKGDKAAEGAAAGAAVGGALGAIAATLAAVGVIIAPGIGLLAAGPIVTALAGAGAGGVTGGLIGLIAGMGVPEHEAKIFADKVQHGSVLVAVRTDRDKATVKKVLERHGGNTNKVWAAS